MKLESLFDEGGKVISRVVRQTYGDGNSRVYPGDWLIIFEVVYRDGWIYYCYQYDITKDDVVSNKIFYKFDESELMDLNSAIAFFEDKKKGVHSRM